MQPTANKDVTEVQPSVRLPSSLLVRISADRSASTREAASFDRMGAMVHSVGHLLPNDWLARRLAFFHVGQALNGAF